METAKDTYFNWQVDGLFIPRLLISHSPTHYVIVNVFRIYSGLGGDNPVEMDGVLRATLRSTGFLPALRGETETLHLHWRHTISCQEF